MTRRMPPARRRTKEIPNRRRPLAWVATGAFAASTALGAKGRIVFASEPPLTPSDPGGASTGSTTMPVRRFEIPPGRLANVLKVYSALTGVHVEVLDAAALDMVSAGVSGVYTSPLALKQILMGMGLSYRLTSSRSAMVFFPTAQESVQVTAPADTVSSSKYTEPLRDTPQSVDVVEQEIMQEQGTTTLRDALRNVAGISLAAGEGGAQGDNLTVRGFPARNDIFIDGMRDFGSYYRDPFDLQEVEVLKGPSSVTFGRGSTGGVVNQEMKSPGLDPFVSGAAAFGTDQTRRATADLEQPLPALGSGASLRLNLMGNDSQIADRDVAENRRFGVAPSLALGLGSPTRLTLSYFHQTENDNPDYGIPWLFNAPAPVDHRNSYGFEDGNFLKTNVDIETARLEQDFSGSVTVADQLRYSHYARDVRITEARLDPSVTPSTPLDDVLVTRNQIAVDSVETSFDNQIDLTVRFETGLLRHTLVTGLEGIRETSDPTRPTFTGVPETSLLDPDESQPFSGASTITSRVHTTATTYAAYVLDTIKAGEKWELTGGLRYDRLDASYQQFVAPVAAFERIDEMPSWRAAVVFKPAQAVSVYLDSGTSFNPSAESLSLSAATANAPPEKNLTYEVGAKWVTGSGLSARAAVFRTEKTNAREPDPTNPLLNVLAGTQRVDGFELEGSTKLGEHSSLRASYAYLDSEVVKSRYYPGSVGYPLANVPRNTFSLWNTWELPWSLQAGLGGRYVGARTASSTAPTDPTTGLLKEVPGYWAFDAMVKRPLSDRLDLQANLYNLTNKSYDDQIHPQHIILGPGRSVLVGLNFRM